MTKTLTKHRVKRAIDILGCLVTLAVLWPVVAVVALLVRLDSHGPVIFRQPRVGQSQELFSIMKFRTMTHRPSHTIDQAAEQVITAGEDARITRIGRFLRSSSLDELPQLINILRGEMSLIGPRPIIPEQLEAIPAQRLDRFVVRPGLTGLAQVNGRRGLDWLEQLALDSEYVRRYNLWLDIKIVLRTVKVVATAAGVYGGEGSNWRAYRPGTEAVGGES